MRSARSSSIAAAVAADSEAADCNEQIDGDGFGFLVHRCDRANKAAGAEAAVSLSLKHTHKHTHRFRFALMIPRFFCHYF